MILNASSIHDNTADLGSAIAAQNSELTMRNTTISGNTSTSAFGPSIVLVESSIEIEHCTLVDLIFPPIVSDLTVSVALRNSIFSRSRPSIFPPSALLVDTNNVWGNESALLIPLDQCTISRCLTLDDGGAVFNSSFGALTVVNSTISGNIAGNRGGGIASFGGSVVCRHATMSGNMAFAGAGGGIFNEGATVITENSIIAGNDAWVGPSNIAGPFTELGNNLLTGDPRLAPLADYGGTTLTRPPLPGSPAIEGAVLLDTTPPNDQIGNPRPSGPLPDLGAVEAVSVAATLAPLTDSEPDGIPDLLEGPGGPFPQLTIGVDDSALDSDGDGTTDANEIADMTDPLDFNDRFRILSIAPTLGFDPFTNPRVELTLATFPGLQYSLETGRTLQDFAYQPGSTIKAENFVTPFTVLFDVERGFVRARRD